MKQLTQTTDCQEMEFKMQEKDRINQNLEERIRLLQTRIVTAATILYCSKIRKKGGKLGAVRVDIN